MTLILENIFKERTFTSGSPQRSETTCTENFSLGSGHAPGHIQFYVKLAQSRVQFEEVGGKAELGLFQPGRKD